MYLRTAYWLLFVTVDYVSSISTKYYDSYEDQKTSADQETFENQKSSDQEYYETQNSSDQEPYETQKSSDQESYKNQKSSEDFESYENQKSSADQGSEDQQSFENQESYEDQGSNEEQMSYNGAQVWRTRLRNGDDVHLINRLLDELAISPWMLHSIYADFLVVPSQKETVAHRLRTIALKHRVLIKDVGGMKAMKQRPSPAWSAKALRLGHRYNYNYYPPLDVIEEYLSYVEKKYRSICYITTIGHSVENRPIKMVTVSNGNPSNQGILLSGGKHGREWVSISSVLYILAEMLTNFDSQPDYVRKKTWYIIPVINPDGYVYTHKADRLWRKNRRICNISNCVGVDLNRNFGYNWNIHSVTHKNPCSYVYSGESPFSEPETVAMRDVLANTSMNLVAVCSVHSYGQLVLYPWASESGSTPHENEHRRIAEEMTMAIFNTRGKKYRYGFAFHKVAPTSGTLIDYVYSSGINISFTIEARDTGQSGFLLSEGQIVPTGKEIQAAVYTMAKALDTRPGD